MKRFVEGVDRGQATLFPEYLEDWICEDNPVRVAPALITLTIFSRGGRGEKAQPLQANTAFLAPNLSPPRPVIVPWSTLCRAQLGG